MICVEAIISYECSRSVWCGCIIWYVGNGIYLSHRAMRP